MARTESTLPGGVRLSDLLTLGVLAEHVPRASIRTAVAASGSRQERHRLLPLDLTALFVVAMSLYRDVAYEEILHCLVEGFRWFGNAPPEVATKGAVTQARLRLGKEAMKLLFQQIARPLSKAETRGAWYRSWLTVAWDGTTLQLPDSAQNGKAFGYPNAAEKASFPLIRCTCLCETGTHAAFAASMGPYATSEFELVRVLLGSLKPGMLLLADQHFVNYDLWNEACATGADLLWRANSNWPLPKLQELSDGSWISELKPPSARRSREAPIPVRVVQYKIKGIDETYRLVTTVLDPERAPALEFAGLYHERWESEGVFDEMKTHLKGAGLTLRSKTPELVEQEFWGLMIAHRALRSLIHEAALANQLDPDEISFVTAVRIVKRTLPGRAALSP